MLSIDRLEQVRFLTPRSGLAGGLHTCHQSFNHILYGFCNVWFDIMFENVINSIDVLITSFVDEELLTLNRWLHWHKENMCYLVMSGMTFLMQECPFKNKVCGWNTLLLWFLVKVKSSLLERLLITFRISKIEGKNICTVWDLHLLVQFL